MREKIGTPVVFTLPKETIAKLDEISKRFDISRAESARKILEVGLDTYRVYEGFGVVKLAEVVKRNRDNNNKIAISGLQRELFQEK